MQVPVFVHHSRAWFIVIAAIGMNTIDFIQRSEIRSSTFISLIKKWMAKGLGLKVTERSLYSTNARRCTVITFENGRGQGFSFVSDGIGVNMHARTY